jgi:hypothetical protein
MPPLYKNYKQADIKNAAPGYTNNAFITPMSHLDTIAVPVISATPVLGESVTIGTSHTYATGKGSIAVYCAPKSIEAPGEMVGEDLAKRFVWKPKIIIVGDGPELLEMVNNLIQESFLLHIEDGMKCQNGGNFIQFGSKCSPCVVATGTFVSGTLADGRKQYEFEVEAYDKYFYNGGITEQA